MTRSFETDGNVKNRREPSNYFGLEEHLESVKETGIPKPWKVTVEVKGLPGVADYAHALCKSLAVRTNRDLPEEIQEDRLIDAFNALLYIRLAQVNFHSFKAHPALHYSVVRYPAILFPVFRAIGTVVDESRGLTVEVQPADQLLEWSKASADQWGRVAETLQTLTAFGIGAGLEMATALPQRTDGMLSILAILEADGRLKGTTCETLELDLMVRSLLGLTMTEQALGIPHVEYNTIEYYRTQYATLAYSCYRR